jgi:hypothetical protein
MIILAIIIAITVFGFACYETSYQEKQAKKKRY